MFLSPTDISKIYFALYDNELITNNSGNENFDKYLKKICDQMREERK